MVRSKRKRTREEIEEALRENERVNATPVGPEDPEDKRRRKARRRQNDSRLNKARRELNLTDRCHTIDGMLSSERVVVDTEESKEDSGNPENSFIRPEVSADQLGGSAQPATTGVALPTADEVREAAKRARRERDRIRRANRTLSQKERDRRKQAEYQRARRARQREARAQAEREWVEAFQASRQASQTEEERIAEREIARLQEEIQRLQMGDEHLATERERDRLYQEERRAAQTEEEKDKEKERGRIRRKCTRRGHALANREHFHKSQVSGEDIEEGRHQLPGQFTCIWCGAWKWPGESDVSCCLKGRVQLSPLLPAPGELQQLYRTAEFREHIQAYNQVFAFTSVGASRSDTGGFGRVREDESVQGQRGVYTYRIQGAMGHYLGSLLPHYDFSTGELAPAKFAQIYFVDLNMQRRALRRESIFAHLSPVTLLALETMIEAINPLAQQFISFGKQLRKAVREGKEVLDIVFKLHADPRSSGTTNLPVASEVGATTVEDGNLHKHRDLLLYTHRGSLLRLFETNPMYDPLQYPLLFPNGELGWTYSDTYANGQLYRKTAKMSLREFVAYRLFPKLGDGSVLHHGGRLFQQWCVDQRAKVEQDSLRWIANNQKLVRADLYKGVADAYLNEHTDALRENEVRLGEFNRASDDQPPRNGRNDHFLNQYGLRRILPGTHTGSPRYMYTCYKDSMQIVSEFGKPDIFLTMTCNPAWIEIKSQLFEGHTAQDRPDIVARVWNLKLRALLADLDEGVLGRVVARIYVVEFQKRGLPHAHILVILGEEDKPRSREIIDKIVSAEIPDELSNPELYNTVMNCMMHGPCGALNPDCACMKDGKCSKGFPKPLEDVTIANREGYPLYRRRRRSEGTLKFKNRVYNNATANQWVVPYNPYFPKSTTATSTSRFALGSAR